MRSPYNKTDNNNSFVKFRTLCSQLLVCLMGFLFIFHNSQIFLLRTAFIFYFFLFHFNRKTRDTKKRYGIVLRLALYSNNAMKEYEPNIKSFVLILCFLYDGTTVPSKA